MLRRSRRTFTSNENGISGANANNGIDASNRYRDAPGSDTVCQELFGQETKEKHMWCEVIGLVLQAGIFGISR